ncbi:MAG: DUF368 domain-containing protein [Desulfobacula sp.]|nr:DUF368 domain-containing protein [Desulfobacula sp.]
MNEPPANKDSLIKELLIGFCLGTANIIPGVSGGTFLLIFNIYKRVFLILGNINKANVVLFFLMLISLVREPGKKFMEPFIGFLAKNDFIFLFKLIIGAVAAILCLSSLMKYLIINQFTMTYALFFGLIFISIVIPVKMLTKKKYWMLFFILAGAFSTIYVSVAVNPYDKVKMKSDIYQKLYLKQTPGQDISVQTLIGQDADRQAMDESKQKQTSSLKLLSFSGKYTVDEYLYAGICGVISISAMVLPGISGSLVMILMGEYFEVVSAISALKTLNLDAIFFLGCFAIGIVFGGLFFARLINMVLNRYYNATMAFLIGLMVGSLYALWPFKKSIVMARQFIKKDGAIDFIENVRVYTNINVVPRDKTQILISLLAFLVGCIIMFFFIRKENQN